MGEEHKIKVQSLTRFYILMLLKSEKKITGYSIIKRLEKDLGTTASPTYVYDFLKQLKAEGYIKDIPTPKSKRAQGFRLTPEGSEFTDRIFLRFNNLIEVAIQSKLKICASCGVKLYDDYYSEVIEGKEYNFCCKHCAKAYKIDK
ncbi:MAG: TA0938 family protein [Promethearchaeota archaeon]|nr:MAG: TA0938 family protein [Candidatus Lokiarchaeota archaeon]